MRLALSTLLAILLILTPKVYAMSIAPKDSSKSPSSKVEKVAETSMILLSCPANIVDADSMCAALKSALQNRAPNHKIQLSDRAPDTNELTIKLHITRADKYAIEGYLEWQSKSVPAQNGPPVTLGVTDTALTPHMYGSFTSGLVKASKLPIR